MGKKKNLRKKIASNKDDQRPSTSKDSTKPKKFERAVGSKTRDSYLNTNCKHYKDFYDQLEQIGLYLRDIPGDGNCLFRALADQDCGDHRLHDNYRKQIVEYMATNRDEFAPFIDEEFDKYLADLATAGTYAGQDAIVAYTRMKQITIVIHQLGQPVWRITPPSCANDRELHIAYHNGEHYSSVRKTSNQIDNDSATSPANVKLDESTINASREKLLQETTEDKATTILSKKNQRKQCKMNETNWHKIEQNQEKLEPQCSTESDNIDINDNVDDVLLVRRNMAKALLAAVGQPFDESVQLSCVMQLIKDNGDDLDKAQCAWLDAPFNKLFLTTDCSNSDYNGNCSSLTMEKTLYEGEKSPPKQRSKPNGKMKTSVKSLSNRQRKLEQRNKKVEKRQEKARAVKEKEVVPTTHRFAILNL